ncbi:hypothetical protein FRC04_007826, partial [Tulasnella sp. 424]
MADHASIRFDGEALKWFENLDDEIQTDWKRLRRAILARYAEPAYEEVVPPQSGNPSILELFPKLVFNDVILLDQKHQTASLTFKGESEAESQEFVSQIRQRAAAEGKENDSEWIVRLAFPCFFGNALKWHASLPSDVRSNWETLERAILLNYPHRPTSVLSPARIQISDWYSFVPPSSLLQPIRSHADWIKQAKERRRLYEARNDAAIPCWLLIENQHNIPDNAIRTGTDTHGHPLYSIRSWYNDAGLVVGKCGPHLP